MYFSSINNQDAEVKNDSLAKYEISNLAIHGSSLEISGYATIEGINTRYEHRIRKTLMIIQNIDINSIREKKFEYQDLTDDSIMEKHTYKFVLHNRSLTQVIDEPDYFSDDELNSLSGFSGSIDLTAINDGKPLPSGEYDVYIKLEQLSPDNDNIKYEKMLPISNITEFLGENVLTTKIQYFSSKKVLKYNLIISFNKMSKTLKIKSSLLQSYNPKDLDQERTHNNRYVTAFKRRFFKLIYILFCILPIKYNKITFASDSRSELNGNLYFVYEELYHRNLGLNIKFLFNERINNKKSIIDLIKIAYNFATSKIILLDDFYPLIYPLKIRKKADLVQVWHAAGAFKTFGYSRTGRPGGPSLKSKNHRNYTKVVVSSEGVRDHYAEGFGVSEDKVFATGVPRSDIFFDKEYISYVQKTLYDKYPYLKDKKVILFAPTFRGNGQASAYYPFENLNLDELYNKLSDEYVFLFKIHPFVKNKFIIPYKYSDFFIDFSNYREINDLLLISDILITDYSSVCFEFALLNKPMLFFAFDVEQYIEERDFYYNYFDFIPGPLIRTTEQIINTIKNEDFQKEKIKSFVDYFFDNNLGVASKNVIDKIIIPSLNDEFIESDEKDKKATIIPPNSRIDLFEKSLENEDK